MEPGFFERVVAVLKAHDVGYFFYIGGNDSSDTVRIVSEEARKAGYPLRSMHIPKTIDNDLVGSDHTPDVPSSSPMFWTSAQPWAPAI